MRFCKGYTGTDHGVEKKLFVVSQLRGLQLGIQEMIGPED